MQVRAVLVAAALLVAMLSPAVARELSLMLRQPYLVAPWRSVFIGGFSDATGINAVAGVWNGGLPALEQQLKSAANTWDLVQVNGPELAGGCAGGLFEKLDWSQIGGKNHYDPRAVSDCGVGATVNTTLLAWDRDKFPGTPTWADFWDVAKFPAKRGLRRGVRGNLEIALMADGVAPGEIYKTLATADGVDRAFRKLDQLRPYIVWWDTAEDAARILSSGDVLMTSAPSASIVEARRASHRNFGLQWNESLYDVLSWAVAKGSPNLRQAVQFLYYSGTPAIQARLGDVVAEGGLAKGANDNVAEPTLAVLPTNPANLKGALPLDVAFWQANLAKLRQRFDAWLAH
jgi:putative spermidine/putrescine transport system substrate-binding protein